LIAGRRFRAPSGNRSILADPPVDTWADLVADNRRALSTDVEFGGLPLMDLRRQAAEEAIAAAQAYHRDAGEPVPSLAGRDPCRIIAAGHQPELFHPGVWAKNFALNGIAQQLRAVPLNLIIDHDTLKAATVHFPAWPSDGRPHAPESVQLATLAYDTYAGEVPFEERPVQDETLFAAFPDHFAERTRNWDIETLVPFTWRTMLARATMTNLLGERIVRARRSLERQWGCVNLELPMSRLASLPCFARFASHLLTDIEQFRVRYNSTVQAYRVKHGIRSRNHPVPDLITDADRIEAPFWIWRAGEARRGRMFVSKSEYFLHLYAGDRLLAKLPNQPGDAWVEAWQKLAAEGIKIRPRALSTTLFARLVLGDFFIHGIGGGKYDEVADVLIADALKLPVPIFSVLTATLHLPLPGFTSHAGDVRQLQAEARDLYWNPQRHIPTDQPVNANDHESITHKQTLIQQSPELKSLRRQRFRELQSLTAAIRPMVEQPYQETLAELDQSQREAGANQRLERRDFAFPLFPETKLQAFMQGIQGSM